MIGMPPPTDAPKYMSTSFFAAVSKISWPYSASSFLFAVTTHLPPLSASRTNVLAMPVPPIVSTMMSIPGSARTLFASVVRTPSGTLMPRSVVMSRSAIFFKTMSTPRRLAMTSRCFRRPSATPAPTVPKPRIPTPICFMSTLFLFRHSPLSPNLRTACRLSRRRLPGNRALPGRERARWKSRPR